jgi:hypothetical protein
MEREINERCRLVAEKSLAILNSLLMHNDGQIKRKTRKTKKDRIYEAVGRQLKEDFKALRICS